MKRDQPYATAQRERNGNGYSSSTIGGAAEITVANERTPAKRVVDVDQELVGGLVVEHPLQGLFVGVFEARDGERLAVACFEIHAYHLVRSLVGDGSYGRCCPWPMGPGAVEPVAGERMPTEFGVAKSAVASGGSSANDQFGDRNVTTGIAKHPPSPATQIP
jgi:hypothetical protein